ncbi:group 1 truncated hemoglobin [Nocardia sp. NPDC005366]|uniref:group I truncated hemoglobin n=1 Tax=Nocardia sp. NPDC005366 TaxID=3156878 RepID=UPI0033A9D48F
MYPASAFEPEPTALGGPPIYEQIGGREALETVVEDFYARVLDDQALSPFFTGTNMARLKGRQVEFFSAALGGPDPYIGAAMRQVHQGRGITRHHFDLVAGHLSGALSAAGVTPDLAARIIAVVATSADDIVSAPAPGRSHPSPSGRGETS